MTDKKTELRKQAEEKASHFTTIEDLKPEDGDTLPQGVPTRQTLHELRVHQIELEIQNDELRRAQAETENLRAQYFDLYDLAPVGYLTVSEKGLILEANLTAANLLGVAKKSLILQLLTRFIIKEDQEIYYRHHKGLLQTHSTSSGQAGAPQSWEMRLLKKDGTAFWAKIEGNTAPDGDGAPTCRMAISDISEQKRAEEALQQLAGLEERVRERTSQIAAANKELEIFNQSMIGREQRIIAMKEEVNALCRELGREPKYPPVWREGAEA
ncbi:MAG: PAS domain-containing protein [Deltaproteobacteria bacterium]